MGYEMSVRKDEKGQWHVDFSQDGERIHRRLPKGSNKSDAEKLEIALRHALTVTKRPYIEGDPPLMDVLALYMTHAETLTAPAEARLSALRIGRWCEAMKASQAEAAVRHFVEDTLERPNDPSFKGYRPATINKSIGALKKALTIAWEKGYTPINYGAKIRRLPENNLRDDYLTFEEAAQIANFCQPRPRAVIWFCMLTGCRRGEALKVRPEHIFEDRIFIPSENTKTKRGRYVPITSALRPWLEMIPFGIKASGVQSAFRRARVKANLPNKRFHDTRHGNATMMLKHGADLATVGKQLGHSTPLMTQRYAKVLLETQRNVLERFDPYGEQKGTGT